MNPAELTELRAMYGDNTFRGRAITALCDALQAYQAENLVWQQELAKYASPAEETIKRLRRFNDVVTERNAALAENTRLEHMLEVKRISEAGWSRECEELRNEVGRLRNNLGWERNERDRLASQVTALELVLEDYEYRYGRVYERPAALGSLEERSLEEQPEETR